MSQKSKWGPQLSQPGWIATPGHAHSPHLFGGASWHIESANDLVLPTLLLSLDVGRLPEPVSGSSVTCLPLVTYLNCETDSEVQEYRFEERTWRIHWLVGQCKEGRQLPQELRLPAPLPEVRVDLRPMQPQEIPDTEANYWAACDSFLGGEGILRVLGAPLWLTVPLEFHCSCGRAMKYVASLGYELPDTPSRFLKGGQVLFVGEMAFYFFLCGACLRVRVATQST
ncbi:hypothetical protein [Hyalangium versicolor]|uniref:hypothetical protein n=1 Tax=Hyalangium versicolor TaxID=2861190 RepID=UPI001CCC47C6|nr:hypothetical protein [Hyalangium versicolor]